MPQHPQEDRPVYSFISCSLKQAAERTGLSESTLSRAIHSGDLTAHYGGDKASKTLLRAADLDDWVQRMPTASPLERDWMKRGAYWR